MQRQQPMPECSHIRAEVLNILTAAKTEPLHGGEGVIPEGKK
jgi:hypothetical protein